MQASSPLRIDAVNTNINFISKHHFSGAMVRHKYPHLDFISDEEVNSDRIIRTQTFGPNRVGYTVIASSPSDIDD